MANKKITDLQLKSAVTGDLNFPVDDTIQSYRITAAQMFDYIRSRLFPNSSEVSNLSFVTSVLSGALTIALKGKDGQNPSVTNPVRVGFRTAPLTTAGYNIREIITATTLTVSSGSTLGQTSAAPARIWLYLIDAGSSPELAVSGKRFRDDELVSTVAEGGAGAADARTLLYSSTARTSVPVKAIGYIDNTQTVAGSWASAGTVLQLLPGYIARTPTRTILTTGTALTYLTPVGCTQLRIRMAGGGGGGGGAGTGSAAGNPGSNTSFGSLVCTAGQGGVAGGVGGGSNGGTATGGDLNITGGPGGGRAAINAAQRGAVGGGNPLGIPASNAEPNGGGPSPASGYGAGGGSPGSQNTGNTGGGGSGGGYLEKLISDPESSYAYTIGVGGSGGGGGSGFPAGSSGSGGVVIIEEFYT